MKPNIYLLFFLFLITFFNKVQAQKSYINGYVLQLNGDTSWGLLSNAESNKTPDKVWFKPNDSARLQTILNWSLNGKFVNCFVAECFLNSSAPHD